MKKVYIMLNWLDYYDDNDIVVMNVPENYNTNLLVEQIETRIRELREDKHLMVDAIGEAFAEIGFEWEYVQNVLGTVYVN